MCVLANAIGCTSILELGQGWGWSSTAFATALTGKPGASIDSVDQMPRMLGSCQNYVDSTRVEYRFHNCRAEEFVTDKMYDMVYIDLNSGYEGLRGIVSRYERNLKSTGVYVLDGFGGEEGATMLASERHFLPLFYCDKYGHAVSVPEALEAKVV